MLRSHDPLWNDIYSEESSRQKNFPDQVMSSQQVDWNEFNITEKKYYED